jgi:hypothetical protein
MKVFWGKNLKATFSELIFIELLYFKFESRGLFTTGAMGAQF